MVLHIHEDSADEWRPDLSDDELLDIQAEVSDFVTEYIDNLISSMSDEEIEGIADFRIPILEIDSLSNIGENNLQVFLNEYCDYPNDGGGLIIEYD